LPILNGAAVSVRIDASSACFDFYVLPLASGPKQNLLAQDEACPYCSSRSVSVSRNRGFAGTGLAKSAKADKPALMRPGLLRTSLHFLTWACVVLLAILSLMPLEEIEAVRTDLPGQIEHIIAYARSTAIAVAGYGLRGGAARIIGCFWL
jgi:hypothetical protein